MSLQRLAQAVPDWSGGTRIGECLATFAREHLARDAGGRTVVVIVSDGLDRGDPARLARSVRDIRRRARRLVWLNPHKGGNADFQPSTLGMMAAAPHIDLLLSGHDLASLEQLADMLPALR